MESSKGPYKITKPTFVLSEAIPRREYERQHDLLLEALIKHGADVLQVPLVPHAHDSVFMKDSAILLQVGDEWRALMAWPKHPERQKEQSHRRLELENLGFRIYGQSPVSLEGGDLELLSDGRTAFLGYGFRTEPEAAAIVSEFLNRKVILLELIDPDLFHLDLAVASLKDGTVFACREALSEESWKTLENLDCIKELIPVELEEARRFCLNWVEIEDVIIMAAHSPNISKKLDSLGWKVHYANLEEFHERRGSAACLVAKIMDMNEKYRPD